MSLTSIIFNRRVDIGQPVAVATLNFELTATNNELLLQFMCRELYWDPSAAVAVCVVIIQMSLVGGLKRRRQGRVCSTPRVVWTW
jgi:hypothetical protein